MYPGITPELFVEYIDKADNLRDIGLVDEFKEISKHRDGTKVAYVSVKMGIFEREAIFKIQKINLEDGKVLLIQQTCTHPDYPDTGKIVRVDLWRGSLLCPVEGGINVIEFSSFKINGDIPAIAVNLFIGSYICLSFKMLAEKLLEYRDRNGKIEDVTKNVEKL
jgi:hypothetical protein